MLNVKEPQHVQSSFSECTRLWMYALTADGHSRNCVSVSRWNGLPQLGGAIDFQRGNRASTAGQ
jgi:hypothetical protein